LETQAEETLNELAVRWNAEKALSNQLESLLSEALLYCDHCQRPSEVWEANCRQILSAIKQDRDVLSRV